jgi:hypothetical protein
MSHLNAAYGAPAVSKTRNISLGKPMLELLDQLPKARDEKLILAYCKRLRDDPEYVDAALEYTGRNMLFNIRGGRKRKEIPSPEERQATKAAAAARTTEYVSKIKTNLVAGFVCPNGLTVRENLGHYVAKLGLGLKKVGSAAGNRIVGEVLTDNQIQKLYLQK